MEENDNVPSTGSEMAKILKEKLTPLFESRAIRLAFLGGSWATDSQNWWSDIDLFLSFPKFLQLNPREKLTVLTELHLQSSALTGFDEIEIKILESLPLHVQFNAISKGILLYEDEEGRKAEFVEKLLPRYYDHMIWYKRMIEQSIN